MESKFPCYIVVVSFFWGVLGRQQNWVRLPSHKPDVAKKTDSTRYAVPALRFKTCRLLSGNVRKRELTIIQRRILRRLRNKKKDIKRKIFPRENLNSYIQSQTTRKLPLFHGDLPITEMHRGTERTSYIPFLLNPETRSDVIPVRLHFCETLPQARQPISHRRVCVNNGMVSITHLKVSHGDLISFQENAWQLLPWKLREETMLSDYLKHLSHHFTGLKWIGERNLTRELFVLCTEWENSL